MRRFANRTDAGRELANRLGAYVGRSDVLVLGLPRGGVPVAAEVARHLHAPLDVFLVRKLGVPGHEELAMGAIAEGGTKVLDARLIADLEIPSALVEQAAVRERLVLDRHDKEYRGSRRRPDVSTRTVIVVDDGLATGATMEAAVLALKQMGPARVIVAVPVGARESCERIRQYADEVVCVAMPRDFVAVGMWYDDFGQTTDEEVRRLIGAAEFAVPNPGPRTTAPAVRRDMVRIQIGNHELVGDLGLPAEPRGLVVFAHGSGSSRHSPRNQFVARRLESDGLATLLIDLLTEDEEAVDARTGHLRFDIGLLAERLVAILDWLPARADLGALPVGLFGASTGAGAALVAAAERPVRVAAVVSRGGRPDLAGDALPRVVAPTLLIVGGHDGPVIDLNRSAMARMSGTVSLVIVPRATHLFEEPGALDQVAQLAGEWFGRHLGASLPAVFRSATGS